MAFSMDDCSAISCCWILVLAWQLISCISDSGLNHCAIIDDEVLPRRPGKARIIPKRFWCPIICKWHDD